MMLREDNAFHCQNIRVALEALEGGLRRKSLSPSALWIPSEKLNWVKIFLSLMCSSCQKRRTSRRHPFHVLESRMRLTRKVSQSLSQVHRPHRRLRKAEAPLKKSWRSRRSVSRIRYGQHIVKVVRLDDPKVGFGRRASPTPGSYQLLKTSRKVSPPATMTPRVPGTTGDAIRMVEKKAKEKMEYRQQICELLAAGRPASVAKPKDRALARRDPRHLERDPILRKGQRRLRPPRSWKRFLSLQLMWLHFDWALRKILVLRLTSYMTGTKIILVRPAGAEGLEPSSGICKRHSGTRRKVGPALGIAIRDGLAPLSRPRQRSCSTRKE